MLNNILVGLAIFGALLVYSIIGLLVGAFIEKRPTESFADSLDDLLSGLTAHTALIYLAFWPFWIALTLSLRFIQYCLDRVSNKS